MATVLQVGLTSPTPFMHTMSKDSATSSIFDLRKSDSPSGSVLARLLPRRSSRKSLQPHSAEMAAAEKAGLMTPKERRLSTTPSVSRDMTHEVAQDVIEEEEDETTTAPARPAYNKRDNSRRDSRRFSIMSWMSKSSRTSDKDSEPPSPKRAPYVPQHAGSDFGAMSVATTYRQSEAYKWHGPGHRASFAMGEVRTAQAMREAAQAAQTAQTAHAAQMTHTQTAQTIQALRRPSKPTVTLRRSSLAPVSPQDMLRRHSLAHTTPLREGGGGSNSSATVSNRNSAASGNTAVSFGSVVWSSSAGGSSPDASRHHSRRTSVATTVSDSHSSTVGPQDTPMPRRRRKSSVGRMVSDYIRPPRVVDFSGASLNHSVLTIPIIVSRED